VRCTLDLALRINAALGRRQIVDIDIGGGLPVNFASEAATPTFGDCVAELRATCPELFDGSFRLMTEFGRALIAKSGVIVTRVEYTKVAGGRHIALAQAGADLFVRCVVVTCPSRVVCSLVRCSGDRHAGGSTVFLPDKWPLRFTVFDPSGTPRTGRASPVSLSVCACVCLCADSLFGQRWWSRTWAARAASAAMSLPAAPNCRCCSRATWSWRTMSVCAWGVRDCENKALSARRWVLSFAVFPIQQSAGTGAVCVRLRDCAICALLLLLFCFCFKLKLMRAEQGSHSFVLVKRGETVDDLLRFWE
jgi:hypothetical protein